MRIEYDKDVDALYIRLQEKYVARTLEIEEGLNLDLDEARFPGQEENGKNFGPMLILVHSTAFLMTRLPKY